MRDLSFPFAILLLFSSACGGGGSQEDERVPKQGPWRLELDLNGPRLPFLLDIRRDEGTWSMHVLNGDESIPVDDVELDGDSITIRMPLFDSEFRGKMLSDDRMEGYWHNHLKGPDYRIPFTAVAGHRERFEGGGSSGPSVSGQWEVRFNPNAPEGYPAIGLFQDGPDGRITGTFLTETGDYRFLEGVVLGDSLMLSCFDGTHAFLFKAAILGDSLSGRFWSGTHWQEPWQARRNPDFRLRDPDSLTFLREGYDMVDFRFPDLEGRPVSPNDANYKGKVLLIQIMGSWCPNCVDETRLLNEFWERYHEKGLEVISVAFEKYEDTERALDGLRRFREVLDVRYPILYAGRSSKAMASEKLPFLNHVMSYPTCIMVDRQGKVRRIRTGYYGPGTGQHFVNYKRSLSVFVERLLEEPA
ncbi:MAG: TlpA family protein disulfide reductase [Flavobacteriales bacterium]|nr:TlpA family protein disulfide reductase [Flavobacteriales bacterium]